MTTRVFHYLIFVLIVTVAACKSRKGPSSAVDSDSLPPELSQLLKRAEAGEPESQFEFFQKYQRIAKTEEEQAEASKWCIKAAEAGNVQALGFVYDLFDRGKGVPRDPVKALDWLLKAEAAKPSYMLSRWIAERYEKGRGTPKRMDQALIWYQKALVQNDGESALRLGEIYWNGDGVAKDYPEAVAYFKEATAMGVPRAQLYLAKASADGRGTEKDPVAAYVWVKPVAYETDGMTLKGLLESVLTPEQKKEARLLEPKLKESARELHVERMSKRPKI